MTTIPATIPLYIEGDVKVGELEIRVRPMFDKAFIDNIADDVSFLGSDQRWHCFETREREREILALIEIHDPAAFNDIVAERLANADANTEEMYADMMAGE